MSGEWIVKQCAPTLAGLKTANMFPCSYGDPDGLKEEIRSFNRAYRTRGVRLIPLRMNDGKALLYLYRPQKLSGDMQCARCRAILRNCGYREQNPEGCVATLAHRFQKSKDFPHEVGLFLGYPPEDVEGFLEDRKEGVKCVGYWKVYGDEEGAKKCFARYRKCVGVYRRLYAAGWPLDKLIVSQY